jgi:hypothetical protein
MSYDDPTAPLRIKNAVGYRVAVGRHADGTCPGYPDTNSGSVRGSYVRAAVPAKDCECQYADDGRVIYQDSDCNGNCNPKCHCGADNHPGHACVDPVTITDPGHTDNRPCKTCRAYQVAVATDYRIPYMVSYSIGPTEHTHGYDSYAGRSD